MYILYNRLSGEETGSDCCSWVRRENLVLLLWLFFSWVLQVQFNCGLDFLWDNVTLWVESDTGSSGVCYFNGLAFWIDIWVFSGNDIIAACFWSFNVVGGLELVVISLVVESWDNLVTWVDNGGFIFFQVNSWDSGDESDEGNNCELEVKI